MPDRTRRRRSPALILAATAAVLGAGAIVQADAVVLTGTLAYGDWTKDAPGVRRRLTPADMPPPYATRSAANGGRIVPRPSGAAPKVPPGFTVELFATGLSGPRLLRVAPNGDIFVAEMRAGSIRVFHAGASGQRANATIYAKGLDEPFGLAFYPPGPDPDYLYVGTVGAVLRFAYHSGDGAASGKPETIVPNLPDGGHSTRDVIFSPDGRKMYVSVGSLSNDQESASVDETRRADILQFNPDGGGERRFATGLRNPVQMAIHPLTGDLWTAVNERDGLGDDLPPDYVTRVREGAFYGWPWYYIGAYTGKQFPAAYRNDLFVALHGSWNRSRRTGYKVVRVPQHDGKPTGEYEDFLTGFVTPEGDVWARPVGVAVAPDGALLVSDDAGGTVWRITYTGAR